MRELAPQAAATLREQTALVVLDVREPWEYARCHIDASLHIPMADVPKRLHELAQDATILVVCHHGMRSRHVGEFLLANGYRDVTNLSGGIDAWARVVDQTLATY